MNFHVVVLLASIVASVNSCEFGNGAIQGLYDRLELFRNTKVELSNQVIPLRAYHFYETDDGTRRLAMQLNAYHILEDYNNNVANEIETKSGLYYYGVGSETLKYKRDENGELTYDVKKFESTLYNDAELSRNFEEYSKQLLLNLKTMRQKMFDIKKGLSIDAFKRVQYFDYTLFKNGDFLIIYNEIDGNSINIFSTNEDGKETISGDFTCNNRKQKFNVVEGKVAVDGADVPF